MLFGSEGVKDIRNRTVQWLSLGILLLTAAEYLIQFLGWLQTGRTTPALWAYTTTTGMILLAILVVVCVYRCSILSTRVSALEADNDQLDLAVRRITATHTERDR